MPKEFTMAAVKKRLTEKFIGMSEETAECLIRAAQEKLHREESARADLNFAGNKPDLEKTQPLPAKEVASESPPSTPVVENNEKTHKISKIRQAWPLQA